MKTMKIEEKVHERLKRYARKDETFSDALSRLLDQVGA